MAGSPLLGIAAARNVQHNLAAFGECSAYNIRHTVRNIDIRKIATLVEQSGIDLAYPLRQNRLLESGALGENVCAGRRHTIGQFDLLQGRALKECLVADGFQHTAFLKYHALHIHRLVEGVLAEARNIFGDLDLCDPCPLTVPGSAGSGRDRIHIAAAAEFQQSVRVQLPGDILTTGSAVEHLSASRSIVDIVADRPLLGIAAARNVQHNLGAPIERRVSDFRHIIGDVNRSQARAVFKYSGGQEARAAGQGRLCQPCTIGENIRSHRCDTVGDHDLGQGVILQERLLTDRFQLAVRFKFNRFQIAGTGKCIVGQRSDAASNVQRFDRSTKRIPRHGIAAGRGIHRAGAAELQLSVCIQNKPYIVTALTGKPHICSCGIHKLSLREHTGLVTDRVLAFKAQAIFIEEVLLGIDTDIPRLILSSDEIHCAVAFAVRCPARIHTINSIFGIAACAALQCTVFTIIHIGMLIIRTTGLFLCIAVQKGIALSAVIALYRDLIFVSLNGQVHGLVIIHYGIKMEIRIIGDIVCLLAGRTADNVYNAVLLIDLTATERLGAGIGMVVTGEHEINTCRLHCRRDHVVDLSVAAGGVGVIRRLMDRQHLPGRIRLFCILLQPFQRCRQLLTVGGIVDHRNIYIAVNHGIMSAITAGGQIIDQRGTHCGCVTCKFVVAQNVDHICLAKGFRTKQPHDTHPIGIAGCVIHGVARLDREIVALILELCNDPLHIRNIFRLNIAENEKLCRTARRFRLEGIFCGPDRAVANSIDIGLPTVEPGYNGAVQSGHGIAALAEGHTFACGIDRGPCIAALDLILEHLGRCAGVCKPGNTVFQAAIAGSMAHQAVRRKGSIPAGVIAGNNISEGKQTVGILGINRIVSGRCAESIRNQHTLGICGADQSTVLQVNTDVLQRIDVTGNLNGALLAYQDRIGRDRVHTVNGKLHGFLGVCILQIANDILAGIQRIAEGIPFFQIGRNIYRNGRNRFTGILGRLGYGQLNHAGQLIILIGSLVSICKFDLIIRKILVKLDSQAIRGGRCRVGVLELQRDLAAQHSRGLHRCKRHSRHPAQIVLTLHKEASGLFQLVTGLILCVNSNGMPSVCQGNAIDRVSSGLIRGGVVVIIVNYIDTVDVYTSGVGIDT